MCDDLIKKISLCCQFVSFSLFVLTLSCFYIHFMEKFLYLRGKDYIA